MPPQPSDVIPTLTAEIVTSPRAGFHPEIGAGLSYTATEIKAVRDTWFLVQRTDNGEGCVTRRVSLVQEKSALWLQAGVSEKELCSGQNCLSCGFADSGGCTCLEPAGGEGASLCNHTMTTSSEYGDWVRQTEKE